jgi:hypothetical protein
MRSLFALFLLFSLSSCYTQKSLYEGRILCDVDTENLTQIVLDETAELWHNEKLWLEKSFIFYSGPESKIRLQFSSQRIMEVCEGRQLLVDMVENLLSRIQRSFIASNLNPNPLTANQLEIYIDFQSFFGEFVDPYYLGWIALEQGEAYYYAFNLKDPTIEGWDVRHEPYLKSRSIVKLEREAERNYQVKHPPRSSSLQRERYSSPL